MNPNELCFTVLGSSGAGKTTLLACMNKFFSEIFAGVFSPGDTKSFEILANSYKALENEANDSEHLDFGIAITNTEEEREYVFNIDTKSYKLPVRFYDFPGGWLNSEDKENYNKLYEIVNRSEIIFVVLNAPYLMEYNGKFIERAKINEIQSLLSQTLQNCVDDKLVLIVPMKCEKYMNELDNLYGRINDAFHDTIGLVNNNNKIALAVVPVCTIGNAKFSRFDFEGEEIVREVFRKQANSIFAPQNIDQPLRFAMSFFLNHFKLPQDLRIIADQIQKDIKIDQAKILSGAGLITGEGITQRKSLDSVEPTPQKTSTEPIKLKRQHKTGSKYKIALMGASGVGKTVFLGSYFKLVYEDAKGQHSIDIKAQESINRITGLIHKLFVDKERVIGTSERVDFSFSVNDEDVKMDIELFDVEGGTTTDINSWIRGKILPDLLDADGALFFMSGYDLVHNREKILKDNMVFSRAISILREQDIDIPIQFVLTKGDKIPEVSIDELKKHIAALIKRATNSTHAENFLDKRFFKKGKHVNVYKSESMGKWPSDTVLPTNYEPKNVTEPMDELITLMYKSRTGYNKAKWIIRAIVAAVVAGVLWGGLYFWDQNNWNKTLEKVEQALRRADYPVAQKLLEDFKSPSFLYPKFIRADNKIYEGYAKYEAALYSLVQSDLATIDEDTLPAMTQDFQEAEQRIESYLKVRNFATVAPAHYEHVRSKKWYFSLGKLFNYDLNQAISSPDNLMSIILECLDQTVPDSWKPRVNEKIESLVRAWCRALPTNVQPTVLESYITAADSLINSQKLSSKVENYLEDQKQIWTSYYVEFVKQCLANYRQESDIPQLKSLMNDYPNMPAPARDTLLKGIQELESIRIDKLASNLAKARSLEELSKGVSKLGADINNDVIQSVLISTMQGLMKDQLSQIRETATGFIKDERFADGRKKVSDSCNLLRNSIRPLIASKQDNTMLKPVDDFEKALTLEIHDSHLNLCRQEFNRNRNSRNVSDIAACISSLNDFIRTWPSSDEAETVKQVLNFLTTIQNGVQGTIYINRGDFSKNTNWFMDPDVYVDVKRGNETLHHTKTVHDDKPNFNERMNYEWKINNSPLEFIALNDVWGNDKALLRRQVNVSGFFGYKNLTRKLQDGKNTLDISFGVSIPKCPWE